MTTSVQSCATSQKKSDGDVGRFAFACAAANMDRIVRHYFTTIMSELRSHCTSNKKTAQTRLAVSRNSNLDQARETAGRAQPQAQRSLETLSVNELNRRDERGSTICET
jgi:hypothetical protein